VDIRINLNTKEQPKQFYRVPHDIERVNYNDGRLEYTGRRGGPVRTTVIEKGVAQPEVYRIDPDIHVILDCECQWLWRTQNPKLSDRKWSTLLGNGLAWTNNTGFPGHYNCITGEDIGTPFPRFDQQRVCGGAILTGYEQNGLLYIDSIRNTQVPTTEDVLSKPWLWYWGTSINPRGEINIITRTGIDEKQYGVVIPNITSTQATLPLDQLHKLPLEIGLPSPTWTP
jgi:hypothetical protein